MRLNRKACPVDVLSSILALCSLVMPTTELRAGVGTVAERQLTAAAGRAGFRCAVPRPAMSPVGCRIFSTLYHAFSSRQVESSLTADPFIDSTPSRKYAHLVLPSWSRADRPYAATTHVLARLPSE